MVKNKKKINYRKKCFECGFDKFYQDMRLREISCLKCGLVLYAPYSPDFVTDGFKFDIVKRKKYS